VPPKIIALAAAITALVFFGARVPHPSPEIVPKAEVLRLFPSDVGSFRIVSRSDDPGGYEWLTYRNRSDEAVDLVVNYGSQGPHDSIVCYWTRGQDPSWQRLLALKTADSDSSAVFDVAVFTDTGATARLVASTECWADGCKESLYAPGVGWVWPSLNMLVGQVKPPIPVAITIASALRTNDHSTLLQALKTFVGMLDLSSVRQLVASR
jgi:hypothetical protein